MDAATKTSLTTGVATILGATLVPYAVKHGLDLTPDQVSNLSIYLVGGGATFFAALAHWIGGIVHRDPPLLPAPIVAVPVTVPVPIASSPSLSTPGASTMKSVLFAIAVLGVALSASTLTGCAEITKLEQKITSPGGQVISQIAVDLAIGAVVGNDPNAKTKAGRVKSIAQKVIAADQGTSVTLSALVAVANSEIAKLQLPPAEQAASALLVQSLTILVSNALTPPPGVTATPASTAAANVQVIVAQLMNQVILATSGYGV
jgi:hypothetical protein